MPIERLDVPADWASCSQDGCIGVRLPATSLCLAHAAEQAPDAFDAELRRIGAEGTVDARGVVISAELLRQLLAAAPREDDRPAFASAHFDQASFQGDARFDGARFKGRAWFREASFQGGASLNGVSFQGDARFDEASFRGDALFPAASFNGRAWFGGVPFQGGALFEGASFRGAALFEGASFRGPVAFRGASFRGPVEFRGATFQSEAQFSGVPFQGGAVFEGARFKGRAWFREASFQGPASFYGASFQRVAMFRQASFQGEASFDGASFQGVAMFRQASFERATQVGPLLARQLVLDGAVFGARVQLEATAAAVCARRAQFPAGVHLRLRFASVVLDDANLAAPAILASAPSPFPALVQEEQRVASAWQRLPPGPRALRWRPRLLSLCRADVAGLRLADVDLRACRFVGAHNLDRLRIQGVPLFARTAGWWRTRRKTLAEEQHWRVQRPGRSRPAGWYPQACQPPASPSAEAPGVLEPARLAALYRDLRKGREVGGVAP